MSLLKNVQFVCIDCEFTGLNLEEDRIIEIGAIRFTLEQTLDSFESLINPDYPISEDSIAIHHITQTMVQDKPKIGSILPKVFEFIGDSIIVGHAVNQDLEMLKKAAAREQIPHKLRSLTIIDTLRLARHYGDSPNNSLSSLANHFNVPSDGAHRALNDVEMNIAIFKHLIRRFQKLSQVLNILQNPIRMKFMPLGKYKGRLFADIPLHYLQWASHADFDQDLLFSIKSEIKKRQKGTGFSKSTNPFSEL